MSLATLRKDLHALADPERAVFSQTYFKHPDHFLGLNAKQMHALARTYTALPLRDVERLLDGKWHEERLVALLILVRRMKKEPDAVFALYRKKLARVDNWDLVDLSAPHIVGAYLEHRDRGWLDELAVSPSLWERRVAMIATQYFIRRNDFADALRIAETLLGDREDLIHKASGWMLREVADRDFAAAEGFLDRHAATMPRTMLRYAIEKFPPALRRRYLDARALQSSRSR